MKLEHLTLTCFRGFDQLSLAFEPDMTILTGGNGVGKTDVLQAIAAAASVALPRLTVSPAPQIGFTATDIKNGTAGLTVSATFALPDAKISVDIMRAQAAEDAPGAQVGGAMAILPNPAARPATSPRGSTIGNVHRVMQARSGAENYAAAIRSTREPMTAATDQVALRLSPEQGNLSSGQYLRQARQQPNQPLALWYGTARRLAPLAQGLPKGGGFNQTMAWRGALDMEDISQNDFANWFLLMQEQERQSPRFSQRFATLEQQLARAMAILLPGVSDLTFEPGTAPRFSVQKDGQRFYLNQLSEGERSLLALIFDLVRRLSIANPDSPHSALEGRAIVLIDEIELHLHPKWQRTILAQLRQVFRQCQFIVTTHSPAVLGEVPARCVRYLERDQGRVTCSQPEAARGVDVNSILQKLMDAPVRNVRYESSFLRNLFMYIENESFAKAQRRIGRLKKILGENDPELVRAQALIHFLQDEA